MIGHVSNLSRKPSLPNRIRYALALPFRALAGTLSELWGGLEALGLFRPRSFRSHGRNREFEKAGRQPRFRRRPRSSASVFREGERQRKRELIEAERENRKYLNGNSAEAVEYREQRAQRNVACSRGETLNYLAQVNAKHRESMPEETQKRRKDAAA